MFISKSKSVMALGAALIFSAGIGISQMMSSSAEAQSSAQAPVILTVNMARLLGTSVAGKDIITQIQALETGAESEIKEYIDSVNNDAKELQGKQETMAEDEFKKQAAEIMRRQQSLPYLKQIKGRELDASEQKAFNEVSKAAVPILDAIVKERGATVLLDLNSVLYAAESTDITETARARLDAKLQKVAVEDIDLIEQARKAQAEAAAQQQQ